MIQRVCCLLLITVSATAKAETPPLFQTFDLNTGEAVTTHAPGGRAITVLLKEVRGNERQGLGTG